MIVPFFPLFLCRSRQRAVRLLSRLFLFALKFFRGNTLSNRFSRGYLMEGCFAVRQKTFAKYPNERRFSPLISEGHCGKWEKSFVRYPAKTHFSWLTYGGYFKKSRRNFPGPVALCRFSSLYSGECFLRGEKTVKYFRNPLIKCPSKRL